MFGLMPKDAKKRQQDAKPPKIHFRNAFGSQREIDEIKAAYVTKGKAGGPKDTPGGENSKKKANAGNANETTAAKGDGGDWTEEEDEQLKTLKAENKTWREIATAMHKPQDQLKKRFKELNSGEDNNDQKQQGNQGQGKNDPGGKGNNAAKTKGKPQGTTTGHPDPAVTIVDDYNNTFLLYPDNVFNFEELQLLAWIIEGDQMEIFERAASRFYDYTSRRIDPRLIQERFGKEKP